MPILFLIRFQNKVFFRNFWGKEKAEKVFANSDLK
jgi:hypothetical protein